VAPTPSSATLSAAAVVSVPDLAGAASAQAQVQATVRPSLVPAWPQLEPAQWLRAGELAFGLVMLVYAESWGSMRSAALAHGDSLDANRELLALGASNVGAALLQGMAVGAGFSATSANVAAGANCRLAGAVALAVVALVLALALPVLHLLPRPALAVQFRRVGRAPAGRRGARAAGPAAGGAAVLRQRRARRGRCAGPRAPITAVVLSLEESADLDSTAVECLCELDQRLARRGQRLVLARVKDAVRELLARCDAQGLGRGERLHWSVADAVQALAPQRPAGP
jgi:MFS superfamily sulfate permease-like transporter